MLKQVLAGAKLVINFRRATASTCFTLSINKGDNLFCNSEQRKQRRLDIPDSLATVHACGELPQRALLDVTVAFNIREHGGLTICMSTT